MYEKELEVHGKCSICRLAVCTMILNHSACKAIDYHDSGIVLPPSKLCGHGRRGFVSLLGWRMEHHAFIYYLYRDNPSFPMDGYVEEIYKRYGLFVAKSTIERWFLTIGPFRGTMRVTSRFPSARDS